MKKLFILLCMLGAFLILGLGDSSGRDKNDEEYKKELQRLRDKQRRLRKEAQDDIAGREVTIMGDKDIPYRLLKKVMATCTDSEYGQISLAVLQKSSDKLAEVGQLSASR